MSWIVLLVFCKPLTPVVPPPLRVISTGLLFFHSPQVKSGTSILFERFATDHSLKGAIELHMQHHKHPDLKAAHFLNSQLISNPS